MQRYGVQTKENSRKCLQCGCRVRKPGHAEGQHHKGRIKAKA